MRTRSLVVAIAAAAAVAVVALAGCAGTSAQQVTASGDASKGADSSGDGGTKAATTATPDCANMLPPDGQAAQLLMVEVVDPTQVKAMVADGVVGGFSLRDNQRSDVAKGIAAATADAPLAPVVAASEEGGTNQSLKYSAGVLPSQGKLTGTSPAAAATTVGDHAAKLAGLGVNMNFAPLAALEPAPSGRTTTTTAATTTRPAPGSTGGASGSSGSASDSRYFGGDPATVSSFVVATEKAMAAKNVTPVVKYWPAGTGTLQKSPSTGTTSKTLPKLAGIDELRAGPMTVFDAAIAAGTPAIMVSNAEVPGLTAAGEPASLSRAAVTDELRGRQHFGGVVITETLGTGPVTTVAPAGEAAERAIAAGADIAVVAGADAAAAAHDRLVEAIAQGRLPQHAVEESVRRVLALKGVDGECFDAVSSYAATARAKAEARTTTTGPAGGSGGSSSTPASSTTRPRT